MSAAGTIEEDPRRGVSTLKRAKKWPERRRDL